MFGVMEICRLCHFVANIAGAQVDQTCVGLAPTTGKTWTSIYDLGFTITTPCRGQHLENSMWTAQATGLWQHYSMYPAETSTCQEQNLLITIATLHARQARFAC